MKHERICNPSPKMTGGLFRRRKKEFTEEKTNTTNCRDHLETKQFSRPTRESWPPAGSRSLEEDLKATRNTVLIISPSWRKLLRKVMPKDFQLKNCLLRVCRPGVFHIMGFITRKSVPSVEQAINLINDTKTLCMKGCFKLHKFGSHQKEVIETILVDERAKGIEELELTKDLLPIERALGVQWFVESDEFHFNPELKDRLLIGCGILSTASSIYDPLGLIAPFLLQGKRILQAICKDGHHWDHPVPDQLRMHWIEWREELTALS